MKINLYLLKFCGLFDFTQKQKIKLISDNTFFERRQILKNKDPETYSYIHDQYYPFFRPFITNENSSPTDFLILNSTSRLPAGNYEKVISSGGEEVTLTFSVSGVEIFLFPAGPGIISLDISFGKPDLSLEDISAFVNAARNYEGKIYDKYGMTELTILELIENRILNMAMPQEMRFSLRSEGGIANYRGSKLKVFQAVDLSDTDRDLQKIIFELGTVSRIGSADAGDDYNAHSHDYYQDVTKNIVNVYNNWKSLSLFDTFTVVGKNYLSHPYTLKTWKENYFRIYIYNLYFKYRLFAINGEGLHSDKKLKRQRTEFYEFIRIYDNDHISYNFLPNLIHNNIKQGLQTHTETEALHSRIERINGIINERSNKLTNAILFGLSAIALIPSNWHDALIEMSEGQKEETIYGPNWFIFFLKVTIIVLIFIIYGAYGRGVGKFFKRQSKI